MGSSEPAPMIVWQRDGSPVSLVLTTDRPVVVGRADPPSWTPHVTVTSTDDTVGRRALSLGVSRLGRVIIASGSASGFIDVSDEFGTRVARLTDNQQISLTPGIYVVTVVGGGGSRFPLTLTVPQPNVAQPVRPGNVTRGQWSIQTLLNPHPEAEWMAIGGLAALLSMEPAVATPAGQRLLLAVNAWFIRAWPKSGRFPNQLNLLLMNLDVPFQAGQDKVPLIAKQVRELNVLGKADYGILHNVLRERAGQRLCSDDVDRLGLGSADPC